MAKSDAEISLKVNMPPPSDFQKMLERANRIIAENKKQLEEYRKTVADVAEGARIMEQRARATGSAEMVKTARAQFTEGWKVANSLDTREERLSQGLGTMEGRVGAVAAAREAGEVTDEQAVALLAKYTAELEKANEAVTELGYSLEVTKGDLITAEAFDEMLGRFEAFRMTMSDTGQAARDFAAEMSAQADAYADEREALNASMPGYEQQAAKLMQLEREYRGLSSAAEAVTGTLAGSQAKVKEALDAYDGSAEAQKKVYEAIDAGSKKALEADTKLQGIAEKRALSEQKRAADEEKAREREAAAAKKRAEQEEERARKEEELRVERERKEAEAAAKREAREAEMAARDAERFEREQFQMKISALSKQELIKVLDDLRKAREAASKADDAETYAKRTREFNMAREQMERTNAALNVQKMMYMQQASAVQAMGNTIEELSTKMENLSEDAEEGELDLVGMAEGTMELASQFQAGLGPMGWFMLGLKALQDVLNKSAKAQKELSNAAKKTTEDVQAAAEANESVTRSIKTAVAQENLEGRLNALQTKYAAINTELDTRVRLLQDANDEAAADSDRMAAEEEHQRNLLRMELERQMLRGDISREEYDTALQNFGFQADEKKAQREAERKRAEEAAAKEEARIRADAAKKASDDLSDAEARKGAFTTTSDAVALLVSAEKDTKEKLWEAIAELDEHLAQGGPELNVWDIPGNLVDVIDGLTGGLGAGDDALINSFELYDRKTAEIQKRVERLREEYSKAAYRRAEKLNRLTPEEYLRQLEEVTRALEIIQANEEAARKKAEDAAAKAEAAAKAAEAAEEYAADVKRRNAETQAAMAETRTTKTAVDKETKALEDKLGELRNKLDEMTDEEIEDELAKSKKGAKKYGKNTPKGIYYRNKSEALRDERSQRKRDRKAPGYIEWLTDEGQRAFADGSAQGNTAQVKQLLDIYEKAKKTTTKKDDELAKALIRLINLETVQNKKLRDKLKAVQENIMQ